MMRYNLFCIAVVLFTLLSNSVLQAQITIEDDVFFQSGLFPTTVSATNSYSQSIYLSNELNVSQETPIYGIAFHCASSERTESRFLQIFLGEVQKNMFTDDGDFVDATGRSSALIKVFGGTLDLQANVEGWYTLWFDNPFYYTGTYNLLVAVNDITGIAGSSQTRFFINSHSNGSIAAVGGAFNVDSEFDIKNNAENLYLRDHRPDVRFMTSPRSDASPNRFVDAPFIEDFSSLKRVDTIWNAINTDGLFWHVSDSLQNAPSSPDGNFAWVKWLNSDPKTVSLTSPWIRMNNINPTKLGFSYVAPPYHNDVDSLYVYYRTASTENIHPELVRFSLLGAFANIEEWQHAEFFLGGCDLVQIRFEVHNHFGYGVGIDNVVVENISSITPTSSSQFFAFARPADDDESLREVSFTMSDLENPSWIDRWSGYTITAGVSFKKSDGQYYYYFVDQLGTLRSMALTSQGAQISSAQNIGTLQGVHQIWAMAYNSVNRTLYAIGSHSGYYSLYKLNPSTAALTLINRYIDETPQTLSINSYGAAYSVDQNGQLYRVNLSSGELSSIGSPIPCLAETSMSYLKSMTFDPISNELFASAYDFYYGKKGIYRINTTDGCAEMVGFLSNTKSNLFALVALPRQVSISENEHATNISLYPNPASYQASIISHDLIVSWELISTTGAIVRSGKGEYIPLNDTPSGLYLVRITTVNSISLLKLIVK